MREQDTVAGDILQTLLCVGMDFSQVLQQNSTSLELFRALRTLTEDIGRVYPNMAVESARLIESLATVFADVRLLVCVSSLVSV